VDNSVILWDKEGSCGGELNKSSGSFYRKPKEIFSHEIPPKTPQKPRWNYVEDPPVVRSKHLTLIESKKQIPPRPSSSSSPSSAPTNQRVPNLTLSASASASVYNSSSSRPFSAPLSSSSSPKSNLADDPSTNRTSSTSQYSQPSQQRLPPTQMTYSHFKENPNYTTLLTEVTSSYHPPKVIPPFRSGPLPLDDPIVTRLKSKELSRTGGGYINNKTGIAAGGNQFVKAHTITHTSLFEQELYGSSPTPNDPNGTRNDRYRGSVGEIGKGKVLNQPGISRNDARLGKCIDDLIVHLCQCESNADRQEVKIEFTNTIRKFGRAAKVTKDKYGRVLERTGAGRPTGASKPR
jgi:hypothetical protein